MAAFACPRPVEAVIEAAVELLYKQSTQLFPGNDDTVPNQVKLAIDPEASKVEGP